MYQKNRAISVKSTKAFVPKSLLSYHWAALSGAFIKEWVDCSSFCLGPGVQVGNVYLMGLGLYGFLAMFGLGHFQRKQDVDLHSMHTSYMYCSASYMYCSASSRCLEITSEITPFFFQTLPRVLTRHCFILVGATAVYLATWGTFLGRTVGVRGFGDKGIVMAGSGPAATQKGLCTAQFCFKMPYLNGYAGKWFLYSTSICMFFLPHVYTSDMPQIYANILYIHFL